MNDVDISHIRKHYLFSSLSLEELQDVAHHARFKTLEADEHLFFQSEPAEHFYSVQSGQIKLTRLTPDGNEKVIEILMPNQTFAEAVMFMDRDDYPVTATAIIPSTVIAFNSRQFIKILHQNPKTCMSLLGDLALRLRGRLQEIENLTMKNATYRVVRFFLSELEKQNCSDGRVELNLQKQLIASRLSIKPETLSRIFSALKTQGILESERKAIVITDIEALRNYE
jgi:CRP-like cAMP-binding protein